MLIVGEAEVDLIRLISSLISFSTSNGLLTKYFTNWLSGLWVTSFISQTLILIGSKPSVFQISIFASSDSLA
ncbi:hypothetical protein D3C73_1594640 [compost metagenome]